MQKEYFEKTKRAKIIKIEMGRKMLAEKLSKDLPCRNGVNQAFVFSNI